MKIIEGITFLAIILLSSLTLATPAVSHNNPTNLPEGNYKNIAKEHDSQSHTLQKDGQKLSADNVENQQAEQEKERTVFITRTEKIYHSEGCNCLKGEWVPFGINNARARGYAPCPHCGGKICAVNK